MKKTWIVVAESSRARIFEATSRLEPLREIEDFVHMDAKLHMLNLKTDKPGLAFARFGYGKHAKAPEVDPKEHEADRFAKQLVEYLEKARGRNEFRSLIIIAEPEFLGLLRKHLHSETRKVIEKEIAKNIVREREERIRREVFESES